MYAIRSYYECFLHDSGVLAVDVSRAPILTTLESRKAVEGAKIMYEPAKCGKRECSVYEVCHPEGLLKGDKCKIVEVLESLDSKCEAGNSLKNRITSYNVCYTKLLRIRDSLCDPWFCINCSKWSGILPEQAFHAPFPRANLNLQVEVRGSSFIKFFVPVWI